MNKTAQEILTILEANGYEAYIVGGYVRDFLLGSTSTDIDICTNATMKEVLKWISGEVNEYHSLNLKRNELNIDITTFRMDGPYQNRRPMEVSYTKELKEDVKRRDFTINTICMNKEGNIIDLLNGREDLQNKCIRMVGEINKKIKEDPLRILRAIRFATTLDFVIEPKLKEEIKKQNHIVSTLSTYRIKEEVAKILTSPNYKKGLKLLKELNLCEPLGLAFTNLVYTKDICGMWAQMTLTKNFPFTKSEKENIVKLREIKELGSINREVIYTYGLYLSLVAAEILGIDSDSIYKIEKEMPIKEKKELDISFQEIVDTLKIKPSKQAGEIEKELIKEVVNGRIFNKKKDLTNYLKSNKTRWFQ